MAHSALSTTTWLGRLGGVPAARLLRGEQFVAVALTVRVDTGAVHAGAATGPSRLPI